MKKTLYILVFLLIQAYGFAEETMQDKIQNILNDKKIEDTYQRFNIARDTLANQRFNLPFEEALRLYNDVLLPFAEKKIKDDHKSNIAKAAVCGGIIDIYEIKGAPVDFASLEPYLTKMLEYAELSEDDDVRYHAYSINGYYQSAMGSVQIAQEYFYKAISISETHNNYERIFSCFFEIAENLLQTRDIPGLRKIIEQMQQYTKKPAFGKNPVALYNFYSVQGAYYGILSEDSPEPETATYNDSTLMTERNIINLIENNKEKLKNNSVAFAYYNMALTYSRRYPERYDSTYYFLDKALKLKSGLKLVDIELDINVYELFAEQHFAQKKYEQAEKDILYVLSLLDQVKDNNSVIPEYTETYKFLVMYYETMNRPAEALKYHKLMLENEKKRYDKDKIDAMDDMLVKYESEKKKGQIDRLTEQNKAARKIMLLATSLTILLLIVLFVLFRLNRLRKKNYDLSIYESALLAELKQSELEQQLKEKEQLRRQYSDKEAQSNMNEQKALLYDAGLKRFQQQMEQKPTKTMIGKLTDLICKSCMEKTKKNFYIRQLSELDIDMMELGYLTANEKISNMDMKYIICFAIDMDVKDMSVLFNVEPASIRSVRYRIKKKFGEKNTFKFLM